VLGQRLGRRLHSLYLYGSVATSKAVWGRSDLDLTLVLANAPSPEEAREIEATRIGLEQAHPGIPKIDFDVGCLADVLDPLNLHSWGFWLKHKCRCIGGEDLASRFAPFRPSRAIALAVNGHFGEVLDGYASRIDAQADSANLPRLMKESARKAIRATNVLRSNDEAAWPETLEEHAQAFRKICPEQADAVDYFMAQQHAPSASAAEFSGCPMIGSPFGVAGRMPVQGCNSSNRLACGKRARVAASRVSMRAAGMLASCPTSSAIPATRRREPMRANTTLRALSVTFTCGAAPGAGSTSTVML
jgi:hypothetical protein